MTSTQPARLIELGLVVMGHPPKPLRHAIDQARSAVLAELRGSLGEFEWRLPVVERTRMHPAPVVEAVHMLDVAAQECESRRWDFAIAITDADLVTLDAAFALGMPARSLSAAVVTTAHLQLPSEDSSAPGSPQLAERLTHLLLHELGHLLGLPHALDPESIMFPVEHARDLDRTMRFSEEELAFLRQELTEVADLRVEERPGPKPGRWGFYLRVAFNNWDDVLRSVRQMAPWQFPFRLSRMTLAGLSSLFFLSMTAEAWELGMNQPVFRVTILSLLAILGSGVFVTKRQRVLTRRGLRRLSEQSAIANISLMLTIMLGMATMYVVLFGSALVFGTLLFDPAVARNWVPELQRGPVLADYLVFSAFVASLGIVVGALGAAFEGEQYFRHVAYVDAET